MSSKTAEMQSIDLVEANNLLLNDLNLEDVDVDFDLIDMSLTSQELAMIDCSNLFVLDEVRDFSNELLEMISAGEVSDFIKEEPKAVTIDEKIGKIQQGIMADITMPLNTMFDEFANIIAKNIA